MWITSERGTAFYAVSVGRKQTTYAFVSLRVCFLESAPLSKRNRLGVDSFLRLLVCRRLDYIQLRIAMVVTVFDSVAREKLAHLPFRD